MFSGVMSEVTIAYPDVLPSYVGALWNGQHCMDESIHDLYYHPLASTAWFAGSRKRPKRRRMQDIGQACCNVFKYSTPFAADALDITAAFKGIDPDEERDPPPDPTPVSFPRRIEVPTRIWSGEQPPPDFQGMFAKVMRPMHLSRKHLEALNFDIREAKSVDDIVPRKEDGSSYMTWPFLDSGSSASSFAAVAQQENTESRKVKDLHDRVAELRVGNDAAFRAVSRTTKEGMKPPRLAYLRKFWEGLENMSQYWDCSLDQYTTAHDPTESPDASQSDPKRPRLDSVPTGQTSPNLPDQPPTDTPSIPTATEGIQAPLPLSPSLPPRAPIPGTDYDSSSDVLTPTPPPLRRYKGRRTSNGRSIPPSFLTTTLTAFAEAAIWPFQSSIVSPRRMPILKLGKLNIPVKLTASVYRMPSDRARARQGWIEGPIMGILGRPEIDFPSAIGEDGCDQTSGIDNLREISALLELAQERRREHQSNRKPGEGEWWTTVPRWGGGAGGEVGTDEGNADEGAGKEREEIVAAVEETVGLKKYSKARPMPRKTPAMLWKELKCGSGIWDSRTVYRAIGKEPESGWDEVFLLSGVCHHVSLLKLTVHEAYLEYLATGKLPDPLPRDGNWCRPRLERSEWCDLFDEGERLKAFLGMWGIMEYLTRETGKAKGGKEGEGTAEAGSEGQR